MKLSEKEFVAALSKAQSIILNDTSINIKKITPAGFEQLTAKILNDLLNYKVDYQAGSSRFPDIVCETFGAEIKLTEADHWKSLGNSIKESTRDQKVKTIFLFFLKKGGTPDIKFKKYEECVDEIVVTHSPRYRINMELEPDGIVFKRMNLTYEEFRAGNPIFLAKKYYSELVKDKPGEALWWLDSELGEAATPILKDISILSQTERDALLAELFSLFPEVLKPTSSPNKYETASLYCVTEHNLTSKNYRDFFSAGGQKEIIINGNSFLVPKVWSKCQALTNQIYEFIIHAPADILKDAWKIDIPEGSARFDTWQTIALDSVGSIKIGDSELTIVDVTKSGLLKR